MSLRIINGPGIVISNKLDYEYVNGENRQIAVVEIAIDPDNTFTYGSSSAGDVLTRGDYDEIEWKNPANPLENDVILRENNIPLQQAWDTLMKALAEYEMTKKLTMNDELEVRK